MNKKQIILVILQLAGWIRQSIAATQSQITACEAQSSYLFIYEQCINCSQNCSLCNGTIGANNTCQIPAASTCLIPGYMFNESNVCQDCRVEENCIKNCDGYWNTSLKSCLRQRNKSYQVQNGLLCLSATTQADCQLCTNQRFQWSTVKSKCLRCPAISTWNDTTQTCSALSTCNFDSGTGFDGSTCSNCASTNTFLSPYTIACEGCPAGCPCTGIYAKCSPNSCISPYKESTDGTYTYCECKGANYSNGTNCLPCSSNCLRCKSDGKCLQCATGFLIDKPTGTCVDCSVPSPDPIYCDIQAFAQCSQKTTDGKYCNTCVQDLMYDSTLRYCVCSNGRIFNTNTNTCALCSDLFPNCGTCNPNQCYTCKDTSFTLAADSKSCSCTGYIKNNTCLQCNTSLANCLTCNATATTCTACASGFGLLTAGTCYACSTINANCMTCDSTSKCLTCTNGYTLNAARTSCDCDVTTTTRAILNNICYTCSNAMANCSKCTKNTALTQLQCTECVTPYVVSSGSCQLCAAGYYRASGACAACTVHAQCKSCSSTTTCFACFNNYTAVSNSCSCVAPSVIDSADSNKCKTCQEKYSPLCATCSASACLTCSGTGYTAATNCSCKGINYPNATLANNKCLQCTANCTTCTTTDTTTTTCTVCDTNYKLLSDNTCVQCGTGKYYNSTTKTCNACNANCSTCADNQNGGSCTVCSNGYQINLTAGTCTCTGTYVVNAAGTACVTCASRWGSNCATCDLTSCLTCSGTNIYLKGSTKLCITCATGTYYKADPTFDCIACQDKCSACNALTGFCTGTCSSNYDLNATTGVCQCQTTKVLNSSSVCVTCGSLMTNCTECSSPTTCTKCSDKNRVMTDGTCQPCPAKKYYDSATKTCKDCGSRCNECADDTGLCTVSCSENYRIENGVCICTKDRSLDTNNACILCSVLFENCIECNSTACTKCNAPFTLTEQGKCRACTGSEIYLSATRECKLCKKLIRNCNSCSSTSVCTDCLVLPFELSQSGDTCNCPAGNYLVKGDDTIDDQCLPCTKFDKKCLQCTNENECTNCADKYFFDPSTKACRNCNSHEYYDSRPDKNIQTCVDCNQVHVECIQCLNATECTSCKDNYDAKQKTCKCTEKKILIPKKEDPKIMECKKCSEIVDPHCDICTDSKICDKCFENYRWDSDYKRCLPNISLQVYSENSGNGKSDGKALADNFNLIFKIPSVFSTAQLRINIYFFDSVVQYDSEVQLLKSQNIANEDIPFSFKSCIVYTTDDLKTLPHPKYTNDDVAKFLRRADTLLLHEGKLKFVYTIESQNSQFVRFATNYDVTVERSYINMKDLAFNMGKQIKNLTPFSVYQVFNQILIQQNEICERDEQCSNNGTCIQADKLCKCSGNFKLFDCSDYVTIAYDLVIEQMTKLLIVDSPTTYQEKFVAQNLPLLVTQSATFSQSAITQNFHAIQSIMKSTTINNNQRDDVDNLMRNIMNNVSKSIAEINTDFTPTEIIQTIKDLQAITDQLLSKYDNNVSFSTDDMQLLAKVALDPSRINASIDSEKAFDVNQDTKDALFTPSQNAQGAKAKVLRYSFKENPHKITTKEFLSQPHTYPLFIVNTYQQSKRMLQSGSSDGYSFLKKNITFTFHVENAKNLKNLICLTLEDTSSDKYIICESISISESTVACSCENSATIYEDVHYNYLPKPVIEKNNEEHVPTSMIIAIVVLSVLLAILLFIQIKNRKKQQEQEKIAHANAVAAAEVAHKRKLEKDAEEAQNQYMRKGSQEMTIATQQYNRTEQYEQGLLSSPPLNVKDIRLNLFDNSPKQGPNEDFILQDNFELNSKHQSNQNEEASPQGEDQVFTQKFAKPIYSNEINTPFSPSDKNFIVKQKK